MASISSLPIASIASLTLIKTGLVKAFSLRRLINSSLANIFLSAGQPSSKSIIKASALLFKPRSNRSRVCPGMNRFDLYLLIYCFLSFAIKKSTTSSKSFVPISRFPETAYLPFTMKVGTPFIPYF